MQYVVVLLCLAACGVTLAGPIVPRASDGAYRLSGEIEPIDYEIYIDVTQTLTLAKDPWAFVGRVTIKAKSTVDKEITEIILHASKMKITAVQVNGKAAKFDMTDKVHEFLKLTFDTPVSPKGEVNIFIEYEGYLRDDMYGFYISSYKKKDDPKTEEHVATTQFQATHARSAFPCFDEPQYKATFKIQIVKPDGYNAISNMPAKTSANPAVIEFEQTPIMSTYLVAFIVSKFDYNAEGDQFKVWARPTAIEQTKYAAANVEKLTEQMRKFTDVNYFGDTEPTMKMKKLDMVALPDFSAGAMENWGLLTYRETALLVDDKVSTVRNVQRVASVITHELAHQWFGDYVTTKWWDNTWLNEGFATYFQYHATGEVNPDWEMDEQFVIEEQQSVFIVDSLINTTPLNHRVETPTEISSHFGSISYNKGGCVIRMMEHFLGTEKFKKGLHIYLKDNAFKTTTPDQLWAPFTEKIHFEAKLSDIMKNWVNNPGYPVISVSRDDKQFIFEQKRFHLQSEKKTEDSWYVPISYTTSDESDFDTTKPKVWLTPTDTETKFEITGDYDWIIVNIQGSGYYRVNYDDNLWTEIQKVLKSDKVTKIHRLNRAQLIDDSMNLARAGELDYTVALEVVDYLSKETDYYPWYSAFEAFRYLLQRYADDDETGADIRAHILTLMQALTQDKTFHLPSSVTKPTDVYNRVNALQWACDLTEENCVNEAKNLFTNLRNNAATDIDKNMKSVVYCTAMRHGTTDDWKHLWSMYEASNVNAEQVTILNALGCSKDKEQLNWYLEQSLTSIRKQDAAYVFSAVYTGNSQGVDIAFEFLKKNYAKIAVQYGGMNALGNAIRGLADRLNTDKQISEFETFLDEKEEELKDVKEIAAAAIEKAKGNVNWANKYKKVIAEFIKKKRDDGSSAVMVMSSAMLCVAFATLVSYLTL